MTKDPGKLSLLRPLRQEIDAELNASLSEEDALAKGCIASSGCFAVRIWQNCIDAIAAKRQAGDGAILVWQRDHKDVQVWVPPLVEKADEPISEQAIEDAHEVMEEFCKQQP